MATQAVKMPFPLDADRHYSGVDEDRSRVIELIPSADHEGYFFVTVISVLTGGADGFARPVKGEAVPQILEAMKLQLADFAWESEPHLGASKNEYLAGEDESAD